MALPKVKFPIYTVTLPVAKKKIQFRPFLAKEEKLLLMAQQSTDIEYIVDTTRQVLNNCIVMEDFDVEKMATPDFEFMFLKLRAKSVGETVEMFVKDQTDGKRYTVVINLDAADVSKNKNKTAKIELGEGIGIVMKPPTLDMLKKFGAPDIEKDETFEQRVLAETIESIYDADEVYNPKAHTEEEMIEFLDQLTPQNMKDIETYYNNLPKVSLTAKYEREDGSEGSITMEGLPAFFQLG